jgi:ankyrin repeat protein
MKHTYTSDELRELARGDAKLVGTILIEACKQTSPIPLSVNDKTEEVGAKMAEFVISNVHAAPIIQSFLEKVVAQYKIKQKGLKFKKWAQDLKVEEKFLAILDSAIDQELAKYIIGLYNQFSKLDNYGLETLAKLISEKLPDSFCKNYETMESRLGQKYKLIFDCDEAHRNLEMMKGVFASERNSLENLMKYNDEMFNAFAQVDENAVKTLIESSQSDINARNMSEGNTLLFLSARANNKTFSEYLLAKNADMYVKNNNGSHALLAAIDNGSTEVVRLLLYNKFDVNFRSVSGSTPLITSVVKKSLEIFTIIISSDRIEIDAIREDGYSALYLAVETGNQNMVAALLSKGAQIDLGGKINALHIAAKVGNVEIFKLLAAKASKDELDRCLEDFLTPAERTKVSGASEAKEISEIFLKYKLDVLKSNCANKPLSPKEQKLLEKFCANPEKKLLKDMNDLVIKYCTLAELKNALVSDHGNILSIALIAKNEELAKYIIEQRIVALYAVAGGGNNALHAAIIYDMPKIAEALVRDQKFRGLDALNDSKQSPLYYALLKSTPKNSEKFVEFIVLIKRMIENGANINFITPEKDSTLNLVMKLGNADIAKIFIEKSNQFHHSDKDGNNALHIAVTQKDFSEIAKLLIAKGISVNQKNHEGHTPLHVALIEKEPDIELIKLLINHKDLDLNIENIRGERAIDLCVTHESLNENILVELLKNNGIELSPNEFGNTIFHYAAKGNNLFALKKLQKKIPEYITHQNKNLQTPMHLAAEAYQIDAFKWLFSTLDIKKQDINGNTALHSFFITSAKHFLSLTTEQEEGEFYDVMKSIFEFLRQAAGEKYEEILSIKNDAGLSIPHLLITLGNPFILIPFHDVFDKFKDMSFENYGCLPLSICASEGYLQMLQTLIHGEGLLLNPQERSEKSYNLINSAISSYLSLYKKHKKNPDDKSLETKLSDIFKTLSWILKSYKTIDIDEYGPFGRTPLYNATDIQDIELVKLLLEEGANPNKAFGSNVDLCTPLMLAVKSQNSEIVNLLLHNMETKKGTLFSKSVDLKHKNHMDNNILHIAAQHAKDPQILSALLAQISTNKLYDVTLCGVISAQNKSHDTPLHLIIKNKHLAVGDKIDLISSMITRGANAFEISDRNGFSACELIEQDQYLCQKISEISPDLKEKLIPEYEPLHNFSANHQQNSTKIQQELKPMFTSMKDLMDQMFAQVNVRLDALESRVDGFEHKFEELSCAGQTTIHNDE